MEPGTLYGMVYPVLDHHLGDLHLPPLEYLHEGIDHVGIKLCPAALHNVTFGLKRCHRFAVGTITAQSILHIGD